MQGATLEAILDDGALPLAHDLGRTIAAWFDALTHERGAAQLTLDAYEREDVLGNVAALEALAADRLGALAARHERIGDVRAVGCFLAIEFVRDPDSKERDLALQDAAARAALERGILADSSTTSLNLQPSLLMPPEALDVALGIVAEAVDETIAGEGAR